MDSDTTTELSTSNPTASIKPTSDNKFKLRPAKYIAPNVPISASGTVAVINSAGTRRRMKANRTRADSAPPMAPF